MLCERSKASPPKSKSMLLAPPGLVFNGENDNAVGEVPGKDQNQKWRASCAVFNGANDNAVAEVPGNVQNKKWRASCAIFNGKIDNAVGEVPGKGQNKKTSNTTPLKRSTWARSP